MHRRLDWRAVSWQALTLVAAGLAAWWVLDTLFANLAARGISSGFGFLSDTAGFGISMSLIPYSETSSFGRAFLVGLLNTLLVSGIGILFATLIGFAVGAARLSRNYLAARLAAAYVETLRNVPLLLQIFFWYFAVLAALPRPRGSLAFGDILFLNNRGLYLPAPEANGPYFLLAGAVLAIAAVFLWRRGAGVATLVLSVCAIVPLALISWEIPALRGFNFQGGMVLIPELLALAIALSTYTAAFIAEIVRAGIQSVPAGQVEAGKAIGLSDRDVMWRVVMPQAMRLIVPPLTNQYLNLAKNSSLAAAIAYPDLVSVFAGTALNITGQAVEVITLTMLVYLAISLAIAGMMAIRNRMILAEDGSL